MPGEGFGFGAALKWVWDNLETILERLKKVREWFPSGSGRGILIIGPGGVGKTTLAAILSGKFDWLTSNPWEYNESYGVDEFTLKDDPKVNIVVPPGQVARSESTWADVEGNLAAGKYRGVIVVGANGYHTLPRLSYKDHPLFKGKKDEFLVTYRRECRNDELAVLKRTTAQLRVTKGKVWLLSLVAKQDLWWPEESDAREFYTTGVYAETIAALAAAKGPQQFRHEFINASLVICNFLSGTGELLLKNAAGYDHRLQVESVRRMFEVLDALREWEGVQ